MSLQPESDPADALNEEVVQMTEVRRCVIHRYDTTNRLKATDRCDRCGAQAYYDAVIRVEGKDQHMLFCTHHATEHGPKLEAGGAVAVYDYRGVLQAMEDNKTSTPHH